jgi:hypothetical protein
MQHPSDQINQEIKDAQFASEGEIASIDLWYNVRREQLLKQLTILDNEYSTMLAECNVKWATRLLELHDLLNAKQRLGRMRVQYRPDNTNTQTLEPGLNDFDELALFTK